MPEGDMGGVDFKMKLNSFHTMDTHQDYVRAMAYAESKGRLFSISDDGTLVVNDINGMRVM